MLVFTRHRSESFVITTPSGDKITICLVGVLGDKAKIGIDAPREYAVNRSEVQEAIEGGHVETPAQVRRRLLSRKATA
jgi:carbon storage regulator CsrA